jgi:subtilisin family serine protease
VLVPFLYWNGLVQLGETDDEEPAPQQDGTIPAATADDGPVRFTGWAQWTGTSFAAPAVAGAIATAIGRDANTLDLRQRRLAGLQNVLHAGISVEGGRLVLNALSSLNELYTVPTRLPMPS